MATVKPEEWSERRSEWRYRDAILDESFDAEEEPIDMDGYERLVFGEADGDMGGVSELKRLARSCDARRKKKTVSTDTPEFTKLPEDPPPGWADP